MEDFIPSLQKQDKLSHTLKGIVLQQGEGPPLAPVIPYNSEIELAIKLYEMSLTGDLSNLDQAKLEYMVGKLADLNPYIAWAKWVHDAGMYLGNSIDRKLVNDECWYYMQARQGKGLYHSLDISGQRVNINDVLNGLYPQDMPLIHKKGLTKCVAQLTKGNPDAEVNREDYKRGIAAMEGLYLTVRAHDIARKKKQEEEKEPPTDGDDIISETTNKNGDTIYTYNDGTVVVLTKDGYYIWIYPDGRIFIMKRKKGKMVKVEPTEDLYNKIINRIYPRTNNENPDDNGGVSMSIGRTRDIYSAWMRMAYDKDNRKALEVLSFINEGWDSGEINNYRRSVTDPETWYQAQKSSEMLVKELPGFLSRFTPEDLDDDEVVQITVDISDPLLSKPVNYKPLSDSTIVGASDGYKSMIAESNLDGIKSVQSVPDVAVLRGGYYKDTVNLLSQINEPSALADEYTQIEDLKKYRVLVLPTASLSCLGSDWFRGRLEEYVNNGGIIVSFTQQKGEDFMTLPGGRTGGYGYDEDMLCQFASSYFGQYETMLSGQVNPLPNLCVDGFFMTYPKDAALLLYRTKNGQPTVIHYKYGNGHVIATTLYSDWAAAGYQATSDDMTWIRDVLAWSRYTVSGSQSAHEYKNGDTIEITVPVINLSESDASSVLFTIIYPWGDTAAVLPERQISLPGGEPLETPVTVEYTVPNDNSNYGYYLIDYLLKDSQGNVIQESFGKAAFIVSRFLSSPGGEFSYQEKPITLSLVSKQYVYKGLDLKFRAIVTNRGNEDKNVGLQYFFFHHYCEYQSDAGKYGTNWAPLKKQVFVPAGQSSEAEFVLEGAAVNDACFIWAVVEGERVADTIRTFYIQELDARSIFSAEIDGSTYESGQPIKLIIQSGETIEGMSLSCCVYVYNGTLNNKIGSMEYVKPFIMDNINSEVPHVEVLTPVLKEGPCSLHLFIDGSWIYSKLFNIEQDLFVSSRVDSGETRFKAGYSLPIMITIDNKSVAEYRGWISGMIWYYFDGCWAGFSDSEFISHEVIIPQNTALDKAIAVNIPERIMAGQYTLKGIFKDRDTGREYEWENVFYVGEPVMEVLIPEGLEGRVFSGGEEISIPVANSGWSTMDIKEWEVSLESESGEIIPLNSGTTDRLKADEQYIIDFTIPSASKDTDYKLRISVGDYTAVRNIKITGTAGAAIFVVQLPDDIERTYNPGEELSIPVKNVGDGPGTIEWQASIEDSRGMDSPIGEGEVTLAPGETGTITFNMPSPSYMAYYLLKIKAGVFEAEKHVEVTQVPEVIEQVTLFMPGLEEVYEIENSNNIIVTAKVQNTGTVDILLRSIDFSVSRVIEGGEELLWSGIWNGIDGIPMTLLPRITYNKSLDTVLKPSVIGEGIYKARVRLKGNFSTAEIDLPMEETFRVFKDFIEMNATTDKDIYSPSETDPITVNISLINTSSNKSVTPALLLAAVYKEAGGEEKVFLLKTCESLSINPGETVQKNYSLSSPWDIANAPGIGAGSFNVYATFFYPMDQCEFCQVHVMHNFSIGQQVVAAKAVSEDTISVEASVEKDKAFPIGDAAFQFFVKNSGLCPVVNMPLTIQLKGDNGYTASLDYNVPVIGPSDGSSPGYAIIDSIFQNLHPGYYTIEAISTLFSTPRPIGSFRVLDNESYNKAWWDVSVKEKPETASARSSVPVAFTVKNTGGVPGTITILPLFAGLDQGSGIREVLLPGEAKDITVNFYVQDDTPSGLAKYSFLIDNQVIDIMLEITGLDVTVSNPRLDKEFYNIGDTMTLTMDAVNNGGSKADLLARCALKDNENRIEFPLMPGESKAISLTIQLVEANIKEKLMFGVYQLSGKALYLNSFYVPVSDGVFSLWPDKQVYSLGDTAGISGISGKNGILYLEKPNKAWSSLTDSAELNPGQNISIGFSIPQEEVWGTYEIEYTFVQGDGTLEIKGAISVDVSGIRVLVKKAVLDKTLYSPGEIPKLKFDIESTHGNLMTSKIEWTIFDEAEQFILEGFSNVSIPQGMSSQTVELNGLNLKGGKYIICYSITSELEGHSPARLVSGSRMFAVIDNTPPDVVEIKPENSSIISEKYINVVILFDEAVDHNSVENGFNTGGKAGSFTWLSGQEVMFTPDRPFDNGEYTVILSGVADTSGNIMPDYTSSFTVDYREPSKRLTGLAISLGELEPQFSPFTYDYRVTVPYTAESVTITPSGYGKLTVNGVETASGTASPAIPLAIGENTITVTAYETGKSPASYTIKAIKEQNGSTVIERVGGSDCYETAAMISGIGWSSSDTVVLSYGEDFPDAFTGIPLAYKFHAPVLLNSTDTLVKATKNEIIRLKAKKVFVLGNTYVISEDVVNELKSLGLETERIGGRNRVETAALIAKKLGLENFDTAVLVNACNFIGAMYAASYAAVNNIPVLLVGRTYIPETTSEVLSVCDDVIVIGNNRIIDGKMTDTFIKSIRISGIDRYAGGVEFIKYFNPSCRHILIASSLEFADGAAGAALAANTGAGILLVDRQISGVVKDYLINNKLEKITILGGTEAVSTQVEDEIKELFK